MPPSAAGSFRLPTLRSVYEFDSYGGVVILILFTYVLSINLSKSWGLSIILVVQIATVSIILQNLASAPSDSSRCRRQSSRRRCGGHPGSDSSS